MALNGNRISLKFIAESLGVSKATVSWVLSGQGDARGISSSMQEKVISFAKEHNYKPNLIAKGLSIGKTSTIGLIISSLGDSFYSGVALSIIKEAERRGYSVMIVTSESDNKREEKAFEMLICKQVDGIIMTPCLNPSPLIGQYAKDGYNLVQIDRRAPGVDAISVVVDNRDSAYKLVSNLIAKGKKNIAIFTTTHKLENMQLRYEGYCDALNDAGLAISEGLFCEVSPQASRKEIADEIDRLLRDVPDVDGIFFTTHVLVVAAYSHFMKLGRDVLNGEAWACIHSIPEFELLMPCINVADIPIEEIGKRSVDIALNNVSSRVVKESLVLPCIFR